MVTVVWQLREIHSTLKENFSYLLLHEIGRAIPLMINSVSHTEQLLLSSKNIAAPKVPETNSCEKFNQSYWSNMFSNSIYHWIN
jgi:hypothetical protein